MHSLTCSPISSPSLTFLKQNNNPLLGAPSRPCLSKRRTSFSFTTKALLSSTKESVLKDFHQRTALKVNHNPFLYIRSLKSNCVSEFLVYLFIYAMHVNKSLPSFEDYLRLAEF